MKRVLIRGPLVTQSGYGQHARQVFRWLLNRPDVSIDVALTPWGNTPWYLDQGECDGLIGEIIKRSVPNNTSGLDASFQVQLPNEWTPGLAKFNVGITAGVETDRCNPQWVTCVNSMDLVVVPSEHVKRTFESSGVVTTKIVVVPESFPDVIGQQVHNDETFSFSTTFNFLVFGQMTGNAADNDRKNTFNAIKWLCEAFSDTSDTGIIIKTNAGRNSCFDRQVTTNLIQQHVSAFRKGPFPRVHLLHGSMNDAEVASLYRHPSVKALVAPTRGEGFGLPILEAASSDLPVIATDWSGHLDFMNRGKFVRFQYDMKEVPKSRVDDQIFVKGARWAEVSEKEFKAKVLKFRSNSFTPRGWAKELGATLRDTHSFVAISGAYDAVLGGVL